MVRKNSSQPAPVTDRALLDAREKAASAAVRLQDAENADPGAPGWAETCAAAERASRLAGRRLEALEQQAAARVEAAGRRTAAARAAAPRLKAAAQDLTASRDQVAAAAAAHLRALAALTAATAEHNSRLAGARSVLAGKGLQAAGEDGTEHAEGTLDGGGLRAAGIDWTPVSGAGVAAHALRQVFAAEGAGHPFAGIGRYAWRPHEIESRPDHLAVPVLAAAPETPRRTQASRPPASSMAAPVEGDSGPVRIGA